MRNPKYEVKLKKAERSQLLHLTRKGKATPRQVKRARILLLAHEGIPDSEIATRVEVSTLTCSNIRRRFQELRVEVIYEKARPGRPAKFSGEEKAKVTALACSEVPQGRGVWTLTLLADKAVELGLVESISRATVQRTLKKMNSSHTESKVGASDA